jgi:hypothetical protein
MNKHEAIHHDDVYMLAQWIKEEFFGKEPYNTKHFIPFFGMQGVF